MTGRMTGLYGMGQARIARALLESPAVEAEPIEQRLSPRELRLLVGLFQLHALERPELVN